VKISDIINEREKTNINLSIPIGLILLIIGEIIYVYYTDNDEYFFEIILYLMLSLACFSYYYSIRFDKVAPDDLLIKLAESEIPQGLKKEISLKLLDNEEISIGSLLQLEQRYYVNLNNKEMAEKFYNANLE